MIVLLGISVMHILCVFVINVVIRQKRIACPKQSFDVLNVFLKVMPIRWPHKIFSIEAWGFRIKKTVGLTGLARDVTTLVVGSKNQAQS
jgi:hypothetical protein